MIKGVHTMFYSSQADELRTFLRDKLDFRDFVDAGDGWLIFNFGKGELAAHPTDDEGSPTSGTADISFYCDDLDKTMAELKGRGVQFADGVEERGYGRVARIKMPGNFEVELYQPLYIK
jgi:catechol 2,3-dioxygenase-like lactoylglutathione lyase family enzyme